MTGDKIVVMLVGMDDLCGHWGKSQGASGDIKAYPIKYKNRRTLPARLE